MKNIFLLPTDKPNRLSYFQGKILFDKEEFYKTFISKNIYITNSEEIKEGDWYILIHLGKIKKRLRKNSRAKYPYPHYQKIILTTDEDLNSVQPIDDDFLEWFVKNPTCEKIETKLVEFEVDMELGESCIEYGSYYKIIIPQEEQKQHLIDIMRGDEELGLYEENKKETLEEAAIRLFNDFQKNNPIVPKNNINPYKLGFINGAKWQQDLKNKYTEQDMRLMYDKSCGLIGLELLHDQTENDNRFKEIISEFKK